MQLSPENRLRFEQDFNRLDATTAQFLRGSGVALSAPPFNTSGVIFGFTTAGSTLILTAKHNLLRGVNYPEDKKPAPSTLVGPFCAAAAIFYGARDFETRVPLSAPLDQGADNGGNTKIFGNPANNNWDYDVMLLKSSDAGLLAQARQYAVVKTLKDVEALLQTIANPGLALKRMDTHVYIQVGFGYSNTAMKDTDKFVGKFQVRYTSPLVSAVAERVYSYDEEAGVDGITTNVVRLAANDENSSAPGDSGGPLFLLDIANRASTVVSLLGVTLGANQSLTPRTVVPDEPITVSTSNYVKEFVCDIFPNAGGC